MQAIVQSTAAEDIALVTLRGCPADIRFISHVFLEIAKRNVNVDMISQTAPVGGQIGLSFTVADESVGRVLEVCALLRTETPQLKTDISGGNCKLSLSGDAMRTQPGVAAHVFEAIAGAQVDVSMITTSEVDISLLIPQASYTAVREKLEKTFSVKISRA